MPGIEYSTMIDINSPILLVIQCPLSFFKLGKTCVFSQGPDGTIPSFKTSQSAIIEFRVENCQLWQFVIFFPGLITDDSFIGLNDNTTAGVYTWVADDSPAGYTNWATDEPSDDDTKLCTKMDSTTGEWSKVDCTDSLASVCQI